MQIDLDAAAWSQDARRVDFTGNLWEVVSTVLDCPPSCRLSQEFGWVAGLTFGRLLALDRGAGRTQPEAASAGSRNKEEVAWALRRLSAIVGDWTIIAPEACAFLLSSLDPATLYSIILVWPEDQSPRRVFFVGVLLGLAVEQTEGTEFMREQPELPGYLLDMVGEEVWKTAESGA